MFLKKIVLKNFKSFAGKNILDFPFLITAIVGPNGSGKSNIVDALRWALGEQKSKNIRIEAGKDLIFAGNEKETAAGFAEVELVFDNSQRVFPLEYSEISIIRRIDRDGNNSYLLNHQSCRRKDIIALSATAKLGLEGLSIVNQGAVEDILRVSPFELRSMIEENIGLKNLELKKDEARRKLSNALINLEEARAREQEILPHLRFLKKQVQRWDKKGKIEEELGELEKKYFAVIYSQIKESTTAKEPQDMEDTITKEIQQLRDNIQKEKDLLDQSDSVSHKDKINALTQEIIQLQNRRSELKSSIEEEKRTGGLRLSGEQLKKKMVLLRDQLRSLLSQSEISSLKQELQKIVQEVERIITGERETAEPEAIKEKEKDLTHLEEDITIKNKLLEDYQKQDKQSNLHFRQQFQLIEEKRKKIEELLREQQKIEISKERLHLRLEDLQRRAEEWGYTIEMIKSFYQENSSLVKEAGIKFTSLERRILFLRREVGEMGARDQNIITEYEEVSSRHDFLSKQIKDLEKGIEDLKILMKTLEEQIEKKFNQALQEINNEFKRYFRLMFGEGSAQLAKIEILKKEEFSEEQHLVPGVAIKINVAKTKLKNMAMLSGGEKTLVAISLMFAVINQSNPPLLVVDEIDAALDEDNSKRFAGILKELSQQTQFIVITHNRLTMNAAQVIYGVTIGQSNTSQLLSIKLEEAEDLVSQEEQK